MGLCVRVLALREEAERGEKKYQAVGEILGRWSLLGLQLKNLNEGFNTKKHRDSSFRRWFAGCLIFLDLHTKA